MNSPLAFGPIAAEIIGQTIVQSDVFALCIIRNGIVVFSSRSFAATFHVAAGSLPLPLHDLVVLSDQERVDQELSRAKNAGEVIRFRFAAQRVGGEIFEAEATAVGIATPDGSSAWSS